MANYEKQVEQEAAYPIPISLYRTVRHEKRYQEYIAMPLFLTRLTSFNALLTGVNLHGSLPAYDRRYGGSVRLIALRPRAALRMRRS